jgi:hypothetical protein
MPKRPMSDQASTPFGNDEILSIVQEIQSDTSSSKDKLRKYRKVYASFAEQCPTLFEMACSPSMDFSKLQYMLTMRARMMSKEISEDSAHQAVGQTFFDLYVKPLVKDMPPIKDDVDRG